MLRSARFSNSLIFSLPLLLIAGLFMIALLPSFKDNEALYSKAITIDLLVTIPLLYFLLIRNTKIPKTTVVPLIILGFISGKYILPKEQHLYLDFFQAWGLPLIEFSILGFVSFKVYKAVKLYKQTKSDHQDFYSVLKKTCSQILPRPVVIPVATEIAVFYYGFLNWRKKNLYDNEFQYHKDSGSIPLFSVIIFLIGIETIVLHILIAMWNETVAWILTLLGIYTLLQLFGFTRSLSKRPIAISSEKIFLRYGIMSETEIDLKDIDSIEISSREVELDSEMTKISLLGNFESHNLIIHLNTENTFVGIYGRKRNFKSLALHVDNSVKFKEDIEALIF